MVPGNLANHDFVSSVQKCFEVLPERFCRGTWDMGYPLSRQNFMVDAYRAINLLRLRSLNYKTMKRTMNCHPWQKNANTMLPCYVSCIDSNIIISKADRPMQQYWWPNRMIPPVPAYDSKHGIHTWSGGYTNALSRFKTSKHEIRVMWVANAATTIQKHQGANELTQSSDMHCNIGQSDHTS